MEPCLASETRTKPEFEVEIETDQGRCRCLGLTVFLLALAPTLAALAKVPWFVTQDGPAHLYNAQIIAESLRPDTSPFTRAYEVRWEPLPNWAGHLTLVGLLSILPARWADRVLTTATFVGFAGALVWLRWRIRGWRGMPTAALLAVLLALNMTWLLGFTSFLLGACLFAVTLGVWWQGRERLSWGRVVALMALLSLGYACHLISLCLTVIGLVVLTLLTPTPAGNWRDRLARTAASALPLIPLGACYLSLSRRGGRMQPIWVQLTNPFSIASWGGQMAWAEPVSIAKRTAFPFVSTLSRGFGLLTPALWLVLALSLALWAMLRGDRSDLARLGTERRGWSALAALLLIGGLASPDTLGPEHGFYLSQRIVLLGLAASVPLLDFDTKRWAGLGAAQALALALAVQSGFVWEYALTCQDQVGALVRARPKIGKGQRVATVLSDIPTRFRANPLLHADCLLGVDTGNVLWTNYESRYYYFPVQFRPEIDAPDPFDFELVSLDLDSDRRTENWARLLERYHSTIDVLVVWGTDPRLDAISLRWFPRVENVGRVRLFRP
jgi:hypothetical protein